MTRLGGYIPATFSEHLLINEVLSSFQHLFLNAGLETCHCNYHLRTRNEHPAAVIIISRQICERNSFAGFSRVDFSLFSLINTHVIRKGWLENFSEFPAVKPEYEYVGLDSRGVIEPTNSAALGKLNELAEARTEV